MIISKMRVIENMNEISIIDLVLIQRKFKAEVNDVRVRVWP